MVGVPYKPPTQSRPFFLHDVGRRFHLCEYECVFVLQTAGVELLVKSVNIPETSDSVVRLTHSLTYSFIHSFTPTFTHSLTESLTHSLTHLLTQSVN